MGQGGESSSRIEYNRKAHENSSFEQAIGAFDNKMLTSEDFFDFDGFLNW